MLVRSRFPEDGDHTGGDVSPSVSRVTNRDSSRGPLVIDTMCTVARIKSAAAVIVSTRADEPFFRGDEPERSPSPHRRRFAKVRR